MNKQVTTGFVLDLEKILNSLVENKDYMAQIGNTRIRFLGAEDKIQVFEIERKVE